LVAELVQLKVDSDLVHSRCTCCYEFTHECLAIRVARKLKAIDVIDILSDLFILHGIPAHIRSDNGPEFVAKAVQEWIAAVGSKTA
jgi:putative transposase